MVGNYKRKSSRQDWSEEDMKAAIRAIEAKEMGWLRASKTFNVPFGTLRRRANNVKGNKFSTGFKKGYMGGKRTTFSVEQEQELVQHVKNLENRFFGMTTLELRKLAYQWAEKNKIPHTFNKEIEEAGWDWLKGFLTRNPTLSLRTPESTSAARARAFNKPQIEKYFDLLSRAMEEVGFDCTKIFNMDESGLSTVPSKTSKIIACKGKKQVGVLTSAERGQHVTVICSISTAGVYVPPGFIYPRKNMKKELMDNAPAGAVAFTQEHGWMDKNIFLRWLDHFVKNVKPTTQDKVLLMLDGHISHKSLEAQVFAKANGIILFCFPPHCTYRVQPLDVAFFGPLTTFYNQELNLWLKNHQGRTVTHYQVAGIFKNAYQKAATLSNAEKGFSTTGIYPFTPDIFPDWMFAPSEVTDLEPENVDHHEINSRNEQPADLPTTATQNGTSVEHKDASGSFQTPSSSNCPVAITDISPIPKAIGTKRKKGSKKSGKVGMLNSTPEIIALKEIVIQKEEAQRRKSARKTKKILKLSEDDDIDKGEEFATETTDEDDVACIYCNELFSRSKSQEWGLKCQICQKWAHCDCAGVSRKTKNFVCDVCI